jgi:putative DNA primase/helicase
MAAREVLFRWSQRIGVDTPVSTSEIIHKANELKSTPPPVYHWPKYRAALMDVAPNRKGDGIDGQRLGLWLRTVNGRVYDGYRIDLRPDKHSKTNRYVLVVVDEE